MSRNSETQIGLVARVAAILAMSVGEKPAVRFAKISCYRDYRSSYALNVPDNVYRVTIIEGDDNLIKSALWISEVDIAFVVIIRLYFVTDGGRVVRIVDYKVAEASNCCTRGGTPREGEESQGYDEREETT